ncbi:MAG: glycosyltransferase family 4 protein [Patescibacteria group bacterium]|nr:glycosyltransferase family 4 protein [Patescibacteria group bacterium]
MKILYVVTKSNWGGAQRHVYDLAVAMKAAGHEVKAAVGGEGILKDKLEAAGVFTYSIASLGRDVSIGKDAGSFREIFAVIKEQQPDVLHLHSPKAAGLGAIAGRLLRVKKIVMTVHGWTWNEDRPVYQKAAIVAASWVTAMLCHKVVVISERDYGQALRLPGLKDKTVLIRLGIKPATLLSVDGAKQSIAKTIGMSPAEYAKTFVIGTIAELHKNKGLAYMIEAIEAARDKHPNMAYIVISGGDEEENLRAKIAELGLEKTVFLAGYIDNAAEYLKAFNVFALPSIKEGFPYVLLEAGAASLPVVATTVGGIPELIDDMRSGILVQPKKPSELAHAVSFMIEHPEERRRYGAALKERVTHDFSLNNMVTEVEKVYW